MVLPSRKKLLTRRNTDSISTATFATRSKLLLLLLDQYRRTLPAILDTRDIYYRLETCQPALPLFVPHIGVLTAIIMLLSACPCDDKGSDRCAPNKADDAVNKADDVYEKKLVAAKEMSAFMRLARGKSLAPMYGEVGGLVRSFERTS